MFSLIFFLIVLCFIVLGVLDYIDCHQKKTFKYEPPQPSLRETHRQLINRLDSVDGRIAYAVLAMIVNHVQLILDKDPDDEQFCHNRVRGHLELVIESIDDYVKLSSGLPLANAKERAQILRGFYDVSQSIKVDVDRINRHLAIQIKSRNEVINQKMLGS